MTHTRTQDWHNLYGEGWQGEIVPEAFSHPAKFSRGLIRQIYNHMIEQGWLVDGDTVLDPFGGVALGALDAMYHGLNWIGCELEQKFVDLGSKNIQLWHDNYGAAWRKWGSARLVQGDSRELCKVIQAQAAGAVSSPPYADGCAHTGGDDPQPGHVKGGEIRLPGIAGAVSSPPYADQEGSHSAKKYADPEKLAADMERKYKDGTFKGHAASKEAILRSLEKANEQEYGTTPGQLGAMKPGEFDASVSSPPWVQSEGGAKAINGDTALMARHAAGNWSNDPYGETPGQLGGLETDTFWTAARQIVEQTYACLRPGGHAVWVVKAYVKNKQRVDFPGQWRQLCEAVGFQTLHEHRAWLVEHKGTQADLFGNNHTRKVERKSFFRRLAEKKGSPRIDYEVVLCMVKP